MKGKSKKTFLRHLLSILAAFALVLGVVGIGSSPASAADAKTIEIVSPSGLKTDETVTYNIYKIFNATSDGSSNKISYSLPADSNIKLPLEAGDKLSKFDKDTGGNIHYYTRTTASGNWTEDNDATELSGSMVSTLSGMTGQFKNAGTLSITGGNVKGTFTVPDYGYYYITTTTGSAVNITSTNPSASITDKNSVPSVDKKIIDASSVREGGKDALAEVGSTVKYQSEISIGKGAVNYVFHDSMGNGLLYGNDVTVYKNGTDESNKVDKENNYTTPTPQDHSFTVKFSDDFIKTLQPTDKIYVVYTAKVTDAALQTSSENGKNTAYVSYGNNPGYETNQDSTQVYNARYKVVKKADSETGEGLAGAGFILKRNSDNKYYQYNNGDINWVDSEDQATQYYSHSDGNLYASKDASATETKDFVGLANGEYTLVEKTVPDGYNKAEDKTFKIDGANADNWNEASNLDKDTVVVNRSGSLLPNTGGIGTVIFYVVGGALVIGAVTLLIKRRKADN